MSKDYDQDAFVGEPAVVSTSVFAELLDSPLLLVPATQGQRFLNYLIDVVTFYVGCFVLGLGLGIIVEITGNQALLGMLEGPFATLLGILLMLTYYFVAEATTGRTMGKLFTRTRVVMEDGTKPTATDILKRTLCRIIPFEAFSFLGGGQGLHDRISHTRVVKLD